MTGLFDGSDCPEEADFQAWGQAMSEMEGNYFREMEEAAKKQNKQEIEILEAANRTAFTLFD